MVTKGKDHWRTKSDEEVRGILSRYGLNWVGGVYTKNTDKLICEDNEGYTVTPTLGNIMRGKRPLRFSIYNPYTMDNIRIFLKRSIPTLQVLSDTYEGSHTKIKYLCTDCNSVRESEWNNLLQGKGCRKCAYLQANEDRSGSFNTTLAGRNKDEWMGIDATVYLVKCYDHIESFYKIGITTRTVEDRFANSRSMPYNYKILGELKTNLYNAIHVEHELHNLHRDFKYTPLTSFDGYTECFTNVCTRAISDYNIKEVKGEK
ncbi:hypothetical protein BCP8-2_092 [Bacillus phage BCP8-2]|uniref:Bacteriophage T5 Orf172 DNA-binding domain-containing protein n=1 Tax=Bacillus phage BCP8-2 TaxID=1129192 RepID=A0A0E3D9F9_9CAUD|nr:hypothetical protein BCP8-2_092 [Bacillus phage BCP8-2]AHJ87130.1 hypothetical protein BCP8-2_092 [Bacillus phage BCP8-2]